MGKQMMIKQGVGIFATMNPIYLKRQKLTENLKNYFRTISVGAPNYDKILEVIFTGIGIRKVSKISENVGKLFKLYSITLSSEKQYDFGLRAMKSLVTYIIQNKK